jgi:hypothetical protein
LDLKKLPKPNLNFRKNLETHVPWIKRSKLSFIKIPGSENVLLELERDKFVRTGKWEARRAGSQEGGSGQEGRERESGGRGREGRGERWEGRERGGGGVGSREERGRGSEAGASEVVFVVVDHHQTQKKIKVGIIYCDNSDASEKELLTNCMPLPPLLSPPSPPSLPFTPSSSHNFSPLPPSPPLSSPSLLPLPPLLPPLLWSLLNPILAKGSKEFDEFLSFLGKKVKLEGWDKFNGGLDTRGKRKEERGALVGGNEEGEGGRRGQKGGRAGGPGSWRWE